MKKLNVMSPLGGTRTDKDSLLMIEKSVVWLLCKSFYREKNPKNFAYKNGTTVTAVHTQSVLRKLPFTSEENG
jgi:hypothetical protein